MHLGMILMSREECVEKYRMSPMEAESIFKQVNHYLVTVDGTPQYLPCDVEMAEKDFVKKQNPAHEFYGGPVDGKWGTAYVAERIGVTQAQVRNIVKHDTELSKAILSHSPKARIIFHKGQVDRWIAKRLEKNQKSKRKWR